MLNLRFCKDVLNRGKRTYSDEEIKSLRDYLYQLAEIEIELKLLNQKNFKNECFTLL